MLRRLIGILGHRGGDAEDGFNLRLWFGVFLGFLALLAGVTLAALRFDDGGTFWPERIWLLALYLFYMSLCCTFFPAPTAWIVLLMASPMFGLVSPGVLEEHFGIGAEIAGVWAAVLTIVVVAAVGALGTAMANLNEYHIFTYLLRFGKVSKLKETGWYQTAARYFNASPFMLIAVVSFLPIPVDVVRWLAISNRYNRILFVWANFLGRFLRYGIFAATAFYFDLRLFGIIAVQAGMIGLMLIGRWVTKRLSRTTVTNSAVELG
ncbi:MAG: hypothetical protein JW936_00390 [Sedimentisphaerales bacterium]|nr:hypothetical protein [Sedimentisphaerales bacterium]